MIGCSKKELATFIGDCIWRRPVGTEAKIKIHTGPKGAMKIFLFVELALSRWKIWILLILILAQCRAELEFTG